MADRYTVSENPFGYEADVGTHRLRYALTDNKPTHISVYVARERARMLRLTEDGEWVPFRHLCYGAHKEDLQALADAMNGLGKMHLTHTAADAMNGLGKMHLTHTAAELDEYYDKLNREIDKDLRK